MINFKQNALNTCLACVLCFCSGISTVQAETSIVVSAESPFESISEGQARMVWLGKKNRLNGLPVVVLDQNDSNTQREFYQKLLDKTPDEMEVYWKKLMFTGSSFAPQKLKNDDQVKAWLAKDSQAIGYLDASSVDASVRVLFTIK